MNRTMLRTLIAIVVTGFSMWVIAGLWHNLMLPALNPEREAHHEGIFILLVAYFILSALMTYFYSKIQKRRPLLTGLQVGMLIGILWVFPHGLAMARAHQTSILYEVQNALWHVVEQGVGGLILASIKRDGPFY